MTLAWLSLGVLVVGVLLEGWRPLALRFTCLQLYLSGLIAIALIVHGLQLSIPYWYLAATLLLAGYVLVLVGSLWITMSFEGWQERLGGALACLLITTASYLLVRVWPRIYRAGDAATALRHRLFPHYLVLSLGLAAALETGWASIDPTALWLQRTAATMAILTIMTLAYRFALPRSFAQSSWIEPSRRMSAILSVVSVVFLAILLGQELVSYNPLEGV